MTPVFEDIVDPDDSPEEREELRLLHELLLSATPPAHPSPTPRKAPARLRPTRRWAMGAAALASVAAALAAGYLAGEHDGFQAGFARPMHGLGSTASASAVIQVGDESASNNRPLLMSVRSLPPLHKGWYELYLTKKGKAVIPCGVFQTGPAGTARVTMNAPADLAEYDGWVVTAVVHGHSSPALLTT